MLAAGDQAPAIAQLSADKPTLAVLFKVSCPVCQLTLPFIERISHSDTVEVLAISQDDEEATAEFRKAFGITFSTILDERRKGYPLSNAFGITHVPSLFLIEPDGNIAIAVSGFSKKDLEQIGQLAGIPPFREGERVPEWKPG